MSQEVRISLETYPRLQAILASLNDLHPRDRELRMQEILGLTAPDGQPIDQTTRTDEQLEDTKAFQSFAAAIEKSVQSAPGAEPRRPGLDWD